MNFILILGILLVLGLASTRVMKKLKLPNVTGYLIIGLLTAFACLLIDSFADNSHLTEELNEVVLGNKESLAYKKWPQYIEELTKENNVTVIDEKEIDIINDKRRIA